MILPALCPAVNNSRKTSHSDELQILDGILFRPGNQVTLFLGGKQKELR